MAVSEAMPHRDSNALYGEDAMLRLNFIWAGHTREAWLAQGIEKYLNRIKKYHALNVVETKAPKGKSGKREKIIMLESEGLEKALPQRAFSIALDERGKMLSSRGLADLISRVEADGIRDVAFVIGGPYGLHRNFASGCSIMLSLSPMTFTHDMARLILAEQVYRACTIRVGAPYHHEG